MFEGEISPDEVWDYITHLPRTSATMAALADDPDVPEGAPRPPSWTEFSPVDEKLADAVDALRGLLANLISLGGGKPPKFTPYPRPGDDKREAAARARHADRVRKHRELTARVLRNK